MKSLATEQWRPRLARAASAIAKAESNARLVLAAVAAIAISGAAAASAATVPAAGYLDNFNNGSNRESTGTSIVKYTPATRPRLVGRRP